MGAVTLALLWTTILVTTNRDSRKKGSVIVAFRETIEAQLADKVRLLCSSVNSIRAIVAVWCNRSTDGVPQLVHILDPKPYWG